MTTRLLSFFAARVLADAIGCAALDGIPKSARPSESPKERQIRSSSFTPRNVLCRDNLIDSLVVKEIDGEPQSPLRGCLRPDCRCSPETVERQVFDYHELKRLLQSYCNIAVYDFDANAALEFERLRAAKLRVGTMDLKIASIALANNATVLPRNTSDFGKIAGLNTEDWST